MSTGFLWLSKNEFDARTGSGRTARSHSSALLVLNPFTKDVGDARGHGHGAGRTQVVGRTQDEDNALLSRRNQGNKRGKKSNREFVLLLHLSSSLSLRGFILYFFFNRNRRPMTHKKKKINKLKKTRKE